MKFFFLLLSFLFSLIASSQVAINNNGVNAASSSMLDVKAEDKGILIPRLTSSQRKAITAPATGLLVYDTDRQTIYLFDGQEWRPFAFSTTNQLPPTRRTVDGLKHGASFGKSVSIYGDYAIIGAPYDSANGIRSGTAYIFYKGSNGWQLQQKLFPSNGAEDDLFGSAVDIYNDVAVIGAPFKTISNIANRGRVYVFKRIGHVWNQVVGLQASDGQMGDQFGCSVSIYNNILLAGAKGREHSNYINAGSVYAFTFSNNAWIQKSIINSLEPGDQHNFGIAIDFWGNTLVVGSPKSVCAGKISGALFTYTTNADASLWVNGQKLEPVVKQDNMDFGLSVAIQGNYIMGGAPFFDYMGTVDVGGWSGFQKSNGTWLPMLFVEGKEQEEQLGTSVAVDGDSFYAGSPLWQEERGRVMVLQHHTEYIFNADQYAPAKFGNSISVHNGQYIIGANWLTGAVHFGTRE